MHFCIRKVTLLAIMAAPNKADGWTSICEFTMCVFPDCPGHSRGTHSPLEARPLGSVATRWQQLDEGMSRHTAAFGSATPNSPWQEKTRGTNIFQKKFIQGINNSLEMLCLPGLFQCP